MTKSRDNATNVAGDISGVTASTGLSGGGSSGGLTLTNTMATAIDAKADLIVGTGADAFSRLGVGANDTILVADSNETTGLKWAAPAGGGATWATWTPSWTNITVGNGTVTARYIQIDKVVFFTVKLLFGSTTSVAGRPEFTLPVSASSTTAMETANIFAQAKDDGVGNFFISGFPNVSDVTKIGLIPWKATGTYVLYDTNISSTVPFTWAVDDIIWVSGNYEVA